MKLIIVMWQEPFIYGLPEAKIEKVTMENIEIDFAENPTPEYPAMMAEVEPLYKPRRVYQ